MVAYFSPVTVNRGNFAISAVDSFVDTAGRSTYTDTGTTFGANHATREIFLCGVIGALDNVDIDITNITIGGVTVHQDAIDQVSIGTLGSFFFTAHALIPTGASGNTVISLNGTAIDCSLSVFRVINRSRVNDNTNFISWSWNDSGMTSTSLGQELDPGWFMLGGVTKDSTSNVTISGDFTEVHELIANGWTFTSGICLPVSTAGNYSMNASWTGSRAWGISVNSFKG
jgi:hypothetical protein